MKKYLITVSDPRNDNKTRRLTLYGKSKAGVRSFLKERAPYLKVTSISTVVDVKSK